MKHIASNWRVEMNLDELKSSGWLLTSECLPLVGSNNSESCIENDEDLIIQSEAVEVIHHPELPMFSEHTLCYYDFANDCWCFDELSGAPMYRPIAWKYIKK